MDKAAADMCHVFVEMFRNMADVEPISWDQVDCLISPICAVSEEFDKNALDESSRFFAVLIELASRDQGSWTAGDLRRYIGELAVTLGSTYEQLCHAALLSAD
jgi:hypothetical protein